MGELYDQFIARTDITIDKWHHYFAVYERYLGRYRNTSPKMLEIGVQNGGSSRLFLDWLGAGAHIVGVDIDPKCAGMGIPGRLDMRIGDQADVGFLNALTTEFGGWDIILDDGGHTNNQIITSFQQLFPHLKDGGTYVIEDTHAHWVDSRYRDHPRGLSVVSLVADLFDNLHRWSGNPELFSHWKTPPSERKAAAAAPYLTRHVGAVHLYDSMIVIEKSRQVEPFSEFRVAGHPRQTDYRVDRPAPEKPTTK